MPSEPKIMLNCYNRGCGQKFDQENNAEDSCRHHPGFPVFHDAYKGWGCCNKKCTDFTEFLNIKGCTYSKHSNEKPPEPPKPVVDKETAHEEVEVKVRAPVYEPKLQRPPFESPLTIVKPTVAPSLQQEMDKLNVAKRVSNTKDVSDMEIAVGTICKNGGCAMSYESPSTNGTICIHHPGVPIFHEGLKFWSCCTKRTSDFNAFLSQVGCQHGKHKWLKEEDSGTGIQCRWDWHQTATHVVVAVYAKQYSPNNSYVKLNPIRLQVHLVFPLQNSEAFDLDLELRGVIDVPKSAVAMLGTKIEIKLVKAEPGVWADLDLPRAVNKKEVEPPTVNNQETADDDSEVDLSDIDTVPTVGGVTITEA